MRRIPTKIHRKQVTSTRKCDCYSTSIKINNIGIGEYYGFTLESYGDPETDNLFFLEDFTIVHNCGSNKHLAKS